MYCPVCHTASLFAATLEPGLQTQRCRQCEGHWLQANAYWIWHNSTAAPVSRTEPPHVAPEDTPGLKWCPDCHHAMHRYRVGVDIGFAVDHCEHCGGVWLDKAEWDVLKTHQLERELYHVFTDAWQRRIKDVERRRMTEAHFRQLLGDEDFERVAAFKQWLDNQADRGQVLAYLQWV